MNSDSIKVRVYKKQYWISAEELDRMKDVQNPTIVLLANLLKQERKEAKNG